MMVVTIILLAAGLGLFLAFSRKAPSQNKIRNDRVARSADEFFQVQKEERAAWFQRTVGAAKALKIVPEGSSPLLHEPVYDCADDRFELPCAHHNFGDKNAGTTIHRIGWYHSFENIEKLLKDFSYKGGGDAVGNVSIALIEGGDHLLMITADQSLSEPGGLAYRIVRTGESEWFVWFWRIGMRRVPEDPPFMVTELAKKPSNWELREEKVKAALENNENFKLVSRNCVHP